MLKKIIAQKKGGGYIPPSNKNDKKQKFTYTKVYPYCWLLQCLSAKLHKHKKSERGGCYKNTEGPNPYPVTNNMGKLLGR